MPRLRILQSVGGTDFSWAAGQIVEVDAATAQAWNDGERAVLVRGEEYETPEGATPRPERAARKRSAPRKSS